MKQSPQDKTITQRMQPGVYSRDGFLGEDSRPLADILDTDRSVVEALGVTHQRLSQRMAEVLMQAMAGCGAPVKIGEHLTAVYREAMGRIPCPFGDGLHAKGQVELTDGRTGKILTFTPLSVHMAGEHGFYQGRGSRYRLEPAELCEIFDLAVSSADSDD